MQQEEGGEVVQAAEYAGPFPEAQITTALLGLKLGPNFS